MPVRPTVVDRLLAHGIYFFDLPEWAPLPDFELSSNACGNQGFGVYNNGAWFYQAWLPVQQPLSMAYKELFPIVLACHVWGPSWSNMRIKFWCDNQSVVHIIQSGTSKDEQIMHLVHALFLVTARFNFCICAAHVPGKTNRLADALSRFNLQEFSPSHPQNSAYPSANTQEFASPSDMEFFKGLYQFLMFHGLAKSTRKTYSASQRQFLEFCYWSKLIHDNGSPLPASEQTLMLFTAHLSRTIKASSIKVYLSGVGSLHIEHGFNNPLELLLFAACFTWNQTDPRNWYKAALAYRYPFSV